MKIKDLDAKSLRIIDASFIYGRKHPLTKNQSGELILSDEQAVIDAILQISSVRMVYHEIKGYFYDYIVFKGVVETQRNRQTFINSIVSLKHLRKLCLIGNFPNINNPRLESPPVDIINIFSNREDVRALAASRIDLAEFKEYRLLFKDPYDDVLKSVAMNPGATKYPEFRDLFKTTYQKIKISLAKNPNATKFEEFRELFKEENYQIMYVLAKNPKAVEFQEFLKLFSCRYFSVRTSLLYNPNISLFKEVYSLIPLYLRRKIIQENKIPIEASKYPEFALLFKDSNRVIRITLACSEVAANHPDYELLFSDQAEEIRAAVAGSFLNPNKFYQKYIELTRDESYLVRLCLFKNIDFLDVPDLFDYLTSLHLSRYIIDPDSAILQFTQLGKFVFSFKLNLRMNTIMEQFVSNPRCVNSRDYREFILLHNPDDFGTNNFLNLVARNPNAPIYNEYRTLFRLPSLHIFIAMNPNAVIFPEFNQFFEKRQLYENLASNLNAPFFRNYRKLFDISDLNVINGILGNGKAQYLYDLSIIKQRKAILKDLKEKYNEFEHFFSNQRVKSRFSGNKIDLHVSIKELERFRHYTLQNPSILSHLTPSSVRNLLNIGLFKLILDKEPAMLLDLFTQIYLGRSPFLHEISLYIDKYITNQSIVNSLFVIQSNIAKLLPKYEKLQDQCLGEMEFFKNFDNKTLKIKNLFDLVQYSGLSFEKIYRLLTWNSYTRFKPYLYIEIPKKSGGIRNISIPVADLEQLQTAIKENILDYVDPHSCVYSFQKNKNPTDNARYHTSNNKIIVIKIDLKDFFPNINIHHVYRLFTNLGYNHDFSVILAHLCTDKKWINWMKGTFKSVHRYYLPQGAPTSPQISNLIFSDVDLEIEQFSRLNNLKYTRYADDLIFSTEDLNANVGSIIRSLLQILKKHRFVYNKEKIQVLRPGVRQSITGVVVNNGIHARKEVINQIRGLLHILKNKISDIHPNYPKMKQQLNGLIAYLNTIEPSKAQKYWAEYQNLK